MTKFIVLKAVPYGTDGTVKDTNLVGSFLPISGIKHDSRYSAKQEKKIALDRNAEDTFHLVISKLEDVYAD